MTERFVLNASALLSLLKSEQGAERVLSVLRRAVVIDANPARAQLLLPHRLAAALGDNPLPPSRWRL